MGGREEKNISLRSSNQPCGLLPEEHEGGGAFLRKKAPPAPPKERSEQGSRERSGCFAERAFAQLRKTSFARGEPGGGAAYFGVMKL